MTLTVWGLVIAGLVELLVYSRIIWPQRTVIVSILIPCIAAISGLYFFGHPNLLRGLVLAIGAYRIINLLRIAEAKMHADYLRRVTLRSTCWLLGLQLLAACFGSQFIDWFDTSWLTVYAVFILSCAVAFVVVTMRNLRRLQPPQLAEHRADHDLPSISVCIPARNETLNLEDCLRSVLASNYPKLEILVLDDASHDRTPDIIKSFAHDGVRFVRGDTPPGTWLAKNWAYQRLFKEASGKYIIFCGVDARFEPDSFRAMVQVMLQEKRQLISFTPRNNINRDWRSQLAILLQPLRYAWELCLPRVSFGRPAVLSTCWIVDRKFMQQYGGFAAVSRMVTPESYFARQAVQQDAYSIMASNDRLAISTRKSVGDQWDTAVRTRYPQLHKRPEFVLLLSLLQIKLFLLPFIVLVAALITSRWLLSMALLASLALYALAYSLIIRLAYRRFSWYWILAFPLAIMLDIGVRHYSLWRYEFKEVVWKGRDVSTPVMHVLSHLPELH